MRKLILILLFIPLVARSESGNSLLWKDVVIRTQNGLTLEASVGDSGRLTHLSIRSEMQDYLVPDSLYCVIDAVNLSSLDIYESYSAEDSKKSRLNLAMNALATDVLGRITRYEFQASGSTFDSYRVLTIEQNGSTHVVIPSSALRDLCQTGPEP